MYLADKSLIQEVRLILPLIGLTSFQQYPIAVINRLVHLNTFLGYFTSTLLSLATSLLETTIFF